MRRDRGCAELSALRSGAWNERSETLIHQESVLEFVMTFWRRLAPELFFFFLMKKINVAPFYFYLSPIRAEEAMCEIGLGSGMRKR